MSLDRPLRARLLSRGRGSHPRRPGARAGRPRCTHTARPLGSYGSDPGVIASLGGSAQDLPGDHTLVSFGPAGRVEEYDAAGHMVWHIEGNAGYVFRAQRIRSLYRPGVGSPR